MIFISVHHTYIGVSGMVFILNRNLSNFSTDSCSLFFIQVFLTRFFYRAPYAPSWSSRSYRLQLWHWTDSFLPSCSSQTRESRRVSYLLTRVLHIILVILAAEFCGVLEYVWLDGMPEHNCRWMGKLPTSSVQLTT